MDNTYNIDFIARCIAGHNKTDIKSIITELENVQKQIGGVSLVEITQEDFDALTDKDLSTIYLVSNGDKITLYIGGTEVNVQSDWAQTTITADDYIKNKPTLGTAAAKNATDTYNATGTDVTTGKAVAEALATLPEPMIFKGSLGTGGTITTLPSASSSNKGYVYKVITAGTYASQSAKVGDTLISDGSTWVLIPSGDEPSGTVTNVAVANGGGLTVSGSPITSSGTITVGHSNSVTAETSSSVKKFTYDAYGHVTGSSELSTDESNALASGIDSTKVAQITTNKNNILTLESMNGAKNCAKGYVSAVKAANPTYSNWNDNVLSLNNTTFTFNSDYTVTINGTTSDITTLLIPCDVVSGVQYHMSGCPLNGSNNSYLGRITNLSGATLYSAYDYGTGNNFTSDTTTICYQIRIANGYAANNIVFKPMIITKAAYDASYTDYQPYAMTNAEITAWILSHS